jgi:predicted GNAT family acetyltransferase
VLAAVDQPQNRRFVLEQDGDVAELEYEVRDGRMILVHTEVPSALAGRGIGGTLVEAAVARARSEELSIEPQCRFARGWLRRQPAVITGLTVDWTARGT